MHVDLILTADYEVWGNGDGCVENCVIEPSKRMMEIAERHGARITFFLDVCEYWAFEKVESDGGFRDNYKPATLIREQLIDAVRRGHDVQLHLHPQWLNYKMLTNDTWELDFRYWRLPEVQKYHDTSWDVQSLIKAGVTTLNDLFKPVKEDYKVIAFRAGAWCIQPEIEVLKALKNEGIIIDSTVAPGISNSIAPNQYDFSKIKMKPAWQLGDMLHETGKSGVYEIPISTAKIGLGRKILNSYLKLLWKKGIAPAGCKRKGKSVKMDQKVTRTLQKILSNQSAMLNFSDGTTTAELKVITNKVLNEVEIDRHYFPLVAISHPKTFGSSNGLNDFLNWTDSKGFGYSTYAEVAERIFQE
jgi:hypothetical protein